MKLLSFLSKNKEILTVYSFALLFFIASSVVSVLRYYQFQSFYFDFGIFDRALWEVAHFQPPLVFHPNFHGVEKVIFADHLNPSMFLLAPLYWITDKREVFLIAQAFIVSVSGLVAYFFSKKFIRNSLIRIGLLFCYFLFVGLQNAMISDIHDATLATLPLMLMFWATEKKKWILYFVMMFIVLGLKESFAGLMVGIGIYVVWRRNFRQGLATIVLSLAWFYMATQFIIPYFSGQEYFYSSGSNANFSFISIFTPFLKIKTLFSSLLSFGFLPVFYPPLWPAIFENFFERFATLSDTRWGLGLHYSATLSPLFFVASVKFVSFLQTKKLPKILFTFLGIFLICLPIFLHRFIFHGPLGLFYNPAFYSAASRSDYINSFISHIPTTGLIMTQNDIAVRLTHDNVTLLDSNFVTTKPRAIAINLTFGQDPNVYFPASPDFAKKIVALLSQDPQYKLTKYGDELYLFTLK